MLLLMAYFLISTAGCQKDQGLIADFTTKSNPEKPNLVKLENHSKGDFNEVYWKFRNQSLTDTTDFEAYFPFEGTYTIRLIVANENQKDTLIKTIKIAEGDPEYLKKFRLVWEDNFNGNKLNNDYWTYATGDHGWGNQELQNYTDGKNAEITDGKLVIHIRKENDKKVPGSYTSSRINTKGKKGFKHGQVEVRAKLPAGKGVWAAIWMLGNNIDEVGWPACGEIDIMEYVGFSPDTVHSTVHTPAGFAGNGDGNHMQLNTCEETFHTYGLIWTPEKMIFYVDEPEKVVHEYAPTPKNIKNWPYTNPAYLIINTAIGGTWGGLHGVDNTIFPQKMEIDHVKVYQSPLTIN